MINNNTIGESLASSYYNDYLIRVVPTLRKKAEKSEFARSEVPFLKKLLVLLPKYAYYANITGDDEDIQPIGAVGDTIVYEVVDFRYKNRVFRFMADLRAVFDKEIGDDERFAQVSCFNEKLQEILADPVRTVKDCLPVTYTDLSGYPTWSLVLCDVIEKELEDEGYELPPVVYQSAFLNTVVPLLREHNELPSLFAKAVVILPSRGDSPLILPEADENIVGTATQHLYKVTDPRDEKKQYHFFGDICDWREGIDDDDEGQLERMSLFDDTLAESRRKAADRKVFLPITVKADDPRLAVLLCDIFSQGSDQN